MSTKVMVAFMVGFCFTCRRLFTFNPVLVPSLLINGVKEPVCAACCDAVNPGRIAAGLEPIIPLPGAYDACDESELV